MDRIEKLDEFIVTSEKVRDDDLVICLLDGSPADFRILGKDFLILFSMSKTDAEILGAMDVLQRAGFRGPFTTRLVGPGIGPVRYYADELGWRVLRDPQIANTFEVVGIEERGMNEG